MNASPYNKWWINLRTNERTSNNDCSTRSRWRPSNPLIRGRQRQGAWGATNDSVHCSCKANSLTHPTHPQLQILQPAPPLPTITACKLVHNQSGIELRRICAQSCDLRVRKHEARSVGVRARQRQADVILRVATDKLSSRSSGTRLGSHGFPPFTLT